MKKVLVLLIWVCCICTSMAQGSSMWSSGGSQLGMAPPSIPMSMRSSIVSTQAHERLAQACGTSLSVNHTSVYSVTEEDPYAAYAGSRRRVGPNKPNEPGAPVGDGMALLLVLGTIYALYAKRKHIGNF